MVDALIPSAMWLSPRLASLLIGVLLVSSLGTGLLFAVSAVVYSRRPTRRYLLVTVAIGALFARCLVGLATIVGVLSMTTHHLLGHGLDFVVAGVLLYMIAHGRWPR